jgi:hypothetical protein
MILPVELLLKIYDYSDSETRIKMNRIFKWSYYVKNPFHNIQITNNLHFRTLVMGTVFTKYATYKGKTIIIPSSNHL